MTQWPVSRWRCFSFRSAPRVPKSFMASLLSDGWKNSRNCWRQLPTLTLARSSEPAVWGGITSPGLTTAVLMLCFFEEGGGDEVAIAIVWSQPTAAAAVPSVAAAAVNGTLGDAGDSDPRADSAARPAGGRPATRPRSSNWNSFSCSRRRCSEEALVSQFRACRAIFSCDLKFFEMPSSSSKRREHGFWAFMSDPISACPKLGESGQ